MMDRSESLAGKVNYGASSTVDSFIAMFPFTFGMPINQYPNIDMLCGRQMREGLSTDKASVITVS